MATELKTQPLRVIRRSTSRLIIVGGCLMIVAMFVALLGVLQSSRSYRRELDSSRQQKVSLDAEMAELRRQNLCTREFALRIDLGMLRNAVASDELLIALGQGGDITVPLQSIEQSKENLQQLQALVDGVANSCGL